MDSIKDDSNKDEILKHLTELEERVSNIEQRLRIKRHEAGETESTDLIEQLSEEEKEDRLEAQIGQFWFAKVGIIIFFIGIGFLMSFPFNDVPPFIPILFGYLISAIVLFFSFRKHSLFSHVAGFMTGGALALLFYSTLRLHYFNTNPIITDSSLGLLILVLVVGIILNITIRSQSVYLATLGLLLGYITAIVSDNHYFIFISLVLLSSIIVYLKLKYDWQLLLFYGIFLTYLSHFIWFINNPIIGNELRVQLSPEINIIFVLLYSIIFSIANFKRKENFPEDANVIAASAMTSLGGYGLVLLITLMSKPEYATFYHLLSSATFLILAIIYWLREKSKFSTFIFAMLGYLALSVAIIIQFSTPGFFLWLCWQSLLVVSTAVWFRSKYIVIANFLIYICLFIAYLIIAGSISSTSLSFGIVALFSARILNWKKAELDLTTDQMRIAYLLTALVIIPYALYHTVPTGFVSISWVAVALIYYLLSVLLKNKKYRWMALLTLLLTVGYVFIIGITSEEPSYRIISFLVLGFVLVIISLIYSKVGKQKK